MMDNTIQYNRIYEDGYLTPKEKAMIHVVIEKIIENHDNDTAWKICDSIFAETWKTIFFRATQDEDNLIYSEDGEYADKKDKAYMNTINGKRSKEIEKHANETKKYIDEFFKDISKMLSE